MTFPSSNGNVIHFTELKGSLPALYWPTIGTSSQLYESSLSRSCLFSARLILILYFYLTHAYMGSIRMHVKLIQCEVYGFIRLTGVHPEEGR